VAAIESDVPLLVEAREIIAAFAFQGMIRRKFLADRDQWLERAKLPTVAAAHQCLVAQFHNQLISEAQRAAVRVFRYAMR
jgi:hypothetical protein